MNRLLADQSVRGRKWSRLQRDIAHVLWPSFIAASAASLFFFAIFDPAQLVAGTALGVAMGLPHAGYTLGFFFFWAFAALSSVLSLYLAHTESIPTRPGADPIEDEPSHPLL